MGAYTNPEPIYEISEERKKDLAKKCGVEAIASDLTITATLGKVAGTFDHFNPQLKGINGFESYEELAGDIIIELMGIQWESDNLMKRGDISNKVKDGLMKISQYVGKCSDALADFHPENYRTLLGFFNSVGKDFYRKAA